MLMRCLDDLIRHVVIKCNVRVIKVGSLRSGHWVCVVVVIVIVIVVVFVII